MQTVIRSSANLILKVIPEDGTDEKIIGFVDSISINATTATKLTYGVDSVFPLEIANGASPTSVSATLSLIMLKGTTLESVGLVPYRTAGGASPKDTGNSASNADTQYIAGGKYCHIRLYDRQSGELWYGLDYAKATTFGITVQARTVVRAQMSVQAIHLIPGNG